MRAMLACMTVDLAAATAFMDTHARQLDRRRYALRDGGGADGVLAALGGYRNADGGYGWGLEPDLRAPDSQPGAALHAFEVFAEIAPVTSPHAAALCDWLEAISLPDGGLPFALPLGRSAGAAPWWQSADPTVSSLQITAAVAAAAQEVAGHDPSVAGHPWPQRATDYCLQAIAAMSAPPFAYVLAFSVRLLDALHGRRPETEISALMDKLADYVPSDGRVPVAGGAEGETLRPLDLAPDPNGSARRLIAAGAMAADLERLAAGQQPDGGWTVDYLPISPAGSMEWRGYTTVKAIDTLRRNRLLA
jgi:hypothetical protein